MNWDTKARQSLTGRQNRVAGEHFEKLIEASLLWYEERGDAAIQKTPEPMKPLRAPNNRGQFLACFTKSAQPDFQGTLRGGRSVVFEAKHTDDDKIEYKRLTDEQIERLEKHHRLGAAAFVLVSLGLQDFYRVPWSTWRDMKEIYGRKHMKKADLEPFRVQYISGVLKLLEGLVLKHAQTEPPEEAMLLIEKVLDTLVEVGNGVTNEHLHEAADQLFRARDIFERGTIS